VGFPSANNTTLVWAGTRGVNPVQTSPGTTYQFNADFVNGASNYTWVLPSGFVSLGPSTTTTSPSIYITTSSIDGVYNLYCSANNTCGSLYMASLKINNGNTGGGGSGCPPGVKPPCKPGPAPLRVAAEEEPLAPLVLSGVHLYPNPAQKNVTISFVQEAGKPIDGDLDSSVEITLHNSLQQLVFSGSTQKSSVDVSIEHLPSSTYYLTIFYKKQVIKRQVIVNH
ncbi:MAG: T9SS type A sorting domain-containing protein, partial [Flammeovirgaceae bacterium]